MLHIMQSLVIYAEAQLHHSMYSASLQYALQL